MRAYDLVLVLRPTLKDEDRKKTLTAIKGFLGSPTVVKEEEWGQKALAYSIKKETSGFYTRLLLELKDLPIDFEKRLFTNDNVLRHLLLRDWKSESKSKKEEVKDAKSQGVKEPKEEIEKQKKVVKKKQKSN